jgi:hypothetical protein
MGSQHLPNLEHNNARSDSLPAHHLRPIRGSLGLRHRMLGRMEYVEARKRSSRRAWDGDERVDVCSNLVLSEQDKRRRKLPQSFRACVHRVSSRFRLLIRLSMLLWSMLQRLVSQRSRTISRWSRRSRPQFMINALDISNRYHRAVIMKLSLLPYLHCLSSPSRPRDKKASTCACVNARLASHRSGGKNLHREKKKGHSRISVILSRSRSILCFCFILLNRIAHSAVRPQKRSLLSTSAFASPVLSSCLILSRHHCLVTLRDGCSWK